MIAIESSTVRNCLPDAWISSSVRPRQGRIRARSPVIRWDRFSLVDTWAELAALHGVRAIHRIRRVREEVAADRKKYLNVSIEHRVHGLDSVISPFLWWFKVELFLKCLQKRFRRTLPHTHRAVTLHIRVAPDTYRTCSRTPDVAAHQQQVHDHRDVVDTVGLLRYA